MTATAHEKTHARGNKTPTLITTADMLHLPDGAAAEKRNARLSTYEGIHKHLHWIHEFDPATQVPSDKQGGTWL